mmetsp:Transcript_55833/g.147605  ORF Transcript_55833/g.147605 Transcript_55833/m.147605 type:complete len:211 (+) Transcript_55833:209-841(+)
MAYSRYALGTRGRGGEGGAGDEARDARDRPPENQRVDVVGALVGVDCLEIAGVPHDVALVGHAVAAQHVAGLSRDVEGLAARVALHHGDELGGAPVLLHQPAHAEDGLITQANLSGHIGELALHELVCSQRGPELPSLQCVVPCDTKAGLGSPESTPGQAKPAQIEAGQRGAQTTGAGQDSGGRGGHVVELDGPCGAGAEREKALGLGDT